MLSSLKQRTELYLASEQADIQSVKYDYFYTCSELIPGTGTTTHRFVQLVSLYRSALALPARRFNVSLVGGNFDEFSTHLGRRKAA